jgi:hypothetical protein
VYWIAIVDKGGKRGFVNLERANKIGVERVKLEGHKEEGYHVFIEETRYGVPTRHYLSTHHEDEADAQEHLGVLTTQANRGGPTPLQRRRPITLSDADMGDRP